MGRRIDRAVAVFIFGPLYAMAGALVLFVIGAPLERLSLGLLGLPLPFLAVAAFYVLVGYLTSRRFDSSLSMGVALGMVVGFTTVALLTGLFTSGLHFGPDGDDPFPEFRVEPEVVVVGISELVCCALGGLLAGIRQTRSRG
jgi:hypothetical protein